MITLNTSYQSLRSSALELNAQARLRGRTIGQLSSGVVAPEGTGNEDSFVNKLRASADRGRATEHGMVNALSFLDAQAGLLQHIQKTVLRMDELALKMEDPTQGWADPNTGAQPDLENYMAEFTKLADEIWDTRQARFNGRDLMYSTGARSTLEVLTSPDGRQKMSLTQSDFSTNPTWRYLLGVTSPVTAPERDPNTVFVTTPADVMDPTIFGREGTATLLEDLSQKMAENGAQRSRLQFALQQVRSTAVQTDIAAGVAGDTDVALAVTSLARKDLLTQGALAIRTQANVLADAALHVLSGSSAFVG
jgi:flagellin-like hook-associated protein FlgL